MKRTDMALEFGSETDEGAAKMTEEFQNGIKATCIDLRKKGERLIGKPSGKYITLHCKNEDRINAGVALAHYIKKLLRPVSAWERVLVAGLGNEWITPDSLGAKTVHKIPADRKSVV